MKHLIFKIMKIEELSGEWHWLEISEQAEALIIYKWINYLIDKKGLNRDGNLICEISDEAISEYDLEFYFAGIEKYGSEFAKYVCANKDVVLGIKSHYDNVQLKRWFGKFPDHIYFKINENE
jgi:hypothetical protein